MDHALGDEATQLPFGAGRSLPELTPGDAVDRCRVTHFLGRGGMGQVYEVERVGLNTRNP